MISRVAQDLILLAGTSDMCSKHAAAIIVGKKVVSTEVNNFFTMHNRYRKTSNMADTLAQAENIHAIKNNRDFRAVLELKNRLSNSGSVLAYHAEENVISKYLATKNKRNIPKRPHIVVVRVNNLGEMMMSKPCSNCIDVMRRNGIKKVTYSVDKKVLITESIHAIESRPSSGHKSIINAISMLDSIILNK